jgi:hypothetical protein
MKKKTTMCLLTAALTMFVTIPAFASGWDQDEKGYFFQFDSGDYARSQIAEIDGVKYAFDQNAYMATGWYTADGNWYYFSPDSGAQLTGWQQLDGKWYYLNPSNGGIMQKSWMKQGNNRYYFDENGVMQVGAFTVDGYYYFAEADGHLRRNTIDEENGIKIRYDDDGKEWYKNEESEVNRQNGGDNWLPVLEDKALLNQRQEIQQSNSEYIDEIKDELYDEFKKEVSKSKTATARQRRISNWKEKANRRLSEVSVTQSEIDAYILQVTQAVYGGDDGTWVYSYEDGNRTYTYTYYGSVNRNDDDDYDYDDFDYDDYD